MPQNFAKTITKTRITSTVGLLVLTIVSLLALNFAAGYALIYKKKQSAQQPSPVADVSRVPTITESADRYNFIKEPEFATDEIIVKFRPEANIKVGQMSRWKSTARMTSLDKLNQQYGVREISRLIQEEGISLSRIYKIKLKKGADILGACKEYADDPAVEYAEPNYKVEISRIPNDKHYPVQWSLNNTGQEYPVPGGGKKTGIEDADIDAPEAWDIHTGAGVVIAVVDTGADYNHEDLKDNMWQNKGEIADDGKDNDGNGYIDDIYGFDFYNSVDKNGDGDYNDLGDINDPDPIDDHGHGTHCSGTIAAVANNDMGVSGICWEGKIMAVKFLSADGSGWTSNAIKSIYYATENGADVMSNSWGGDGDSQALEDAIDFAYEEGVVLVAAAGNSGDTDKSYPAFYDNVIAVAATDSSDKKASFSSYGAWVDVSAPGVDILSLCAKDTRCAKDDNKYSIMSGTSMACPHVAGVAGLIISLNPQLTNKDVTAYIQMSADDLGEPGKDIYFGYGRINAYWACELAESFINISSPADRSFVKGKVDIIGSAFIKDIFQRYELSFAPKDAPQDSTLITSSAQPVQNGLLGVWDTTICPEGPHILTLKVMTIKDKEFNYDIDIIIDNVNEAPIVNLTNKMAVIGRTLEFEVEAENLDDPQTPAGQLEHLPPENLPNGASFDTQTHIFSWLPSNGAYYEDIVFKVRDDVHIVEKAIDIITLYIEESAVTIDDLTQDSPRIYGNIIVWGDCVSRAYMYNISTGKVSLLTTSMEDYRGRPQIYGDTIVWADGRNPEMSGDIYMYNISTGIESPVCTSPAHQFRPQIYGDTVVWQDGRNEDFTYDIYMKNISTGIESPVCTSPAHQFVPQIYGDTIVWADGRNEDFTYDIYMKNISTGIESPVCTSSADQFVPQIYGDTIVWADERNYGEFDIYMKNISTGIESPVCTNPAYQSKPQIYEDKIVWHDDRHEDPNDNLNREIYMYDMSIGDEVRITFSLDTISEDPDIYEDTIVWEEDYFKKGTDIYMARLFYAPKVISITPETVFPGDIITINGKKFGYEQGDSRVEFEGGQTALIRSWTNASITCRVPMDAKSGLVRVITKGGESSISISIKVIDNTLPTASIPGRFIPVLEWYLKNNQWNVVMLNGSGSSDDVTAPENLGYKWEKDDGVQWAEDYSGKFEKGRQTISFIAPNVGPSSESYWFTLTVRDEAGNKSESVQHKTTIQPYFGDVNFDGVVDNADADMVTEIALGAIEMPDKGTDLFNRAEVTADGEIDLEDAAYILKYVAGADGFEIFPVESAKLPH